MRSLAHAELLPYQLAAETTARYAGHGDGIEPSPEGVIYGALKTAGEAGEIADMIGKRVAKGDLAEKLRDPKFREELILEMGDLLWQLSQLAWDVGVTMDEVAEKNLEKLEKRYQGQSTAHPNAC